MNQMQHYLVLAPADHPARTTPETRKIGADCGHEVFISPSGLRLLGDEPEIKTCCLRCTPDEPPAEMYAPAGAREELTERCGVAYADQVFAAMDHYNRMQAERRKTGDQPR